MLRKELRKELWLQDEKHYVEKIRHSKHAWTLELWPNVSCARPFEINGVSVQNGKPIQRWVMCEMALEAYNIFSKIAKNERVCETCTE